jgi:predicted RNase H-like nuclease
MPMGLSDIRFKRKVDSRLRSLLSPFKHQSVFTPPCREALSATSYREALEVNRKVTGKGISIQSWNIAPKIRELDELLQSSKQLQRIIFESHPEICFFFLHKRNPITSGKKTEEGRKQRLAILCAYDHQIKGVFDKSLRSFQRKEVLPDDILDALCLGIVAKKSQQDRLILLKDESGTDAFKIPVRVAYFDPTYEKSK